MSRAVLTARISVCRPMAEPAACASLVKELGIRIAGIDQHGKALDVRQEIEQQPEPLGPKLRVLGTDPSDVPARVVEASERVPNSTGPARAEGLPRLERDAALASRTPDPGIRRRANRASWSAEGMDVPHSRGSVEVEDGRGSWGREIRADSCAPSIRVARTRKRLPAYPPGIPPLDFPDTPPQRAA